MLKFTEIGQLRNVIKEVRTNHDYQGKDENGDAIYAHESPYPTLTFRGTVKMHGCLDENTLITLANGEHVEIKDISVGTYVLSLNTETNLIEENKVLNVINGYSNKEYCELIFDDRSIVCTKDHEFWTTNRGYVKAIELNENDIFETI
jgi:hypothetical protein